MAIEKLNLFSQIPAITGVIPTASGSKKAAGDSFRGDNPFGVGLVNSNLENMSYALPNGKTSNCNTIGIG